jgi:hypothetical protein
LTKAIWMRSSSGTHLTRTAVVLLVVLASAPARGATVVQTIAERGPSTLVVGTAFAVASPPVFVIDATRGRLSSLQACRFGHGLKMIVAGAVLLPAGLLATPFAPARLPDAWMDGVVDAFQEDYCTRPLTSVLP